MTIAQEALHGLTVPTLANAIESFGVLAPNAGYNREAIHCHFPQLGMLVAHAVTITTSTDTQLDPSSQSFRTPTNRPAARCGVNGTRTCTEASGVWERSPTVQFATSMRSNASGSTHSRPRSRWVT